MLFKKILNYFVVQFLINIFDPTLFGLDFVLNQFIFNII
jgi:hypothetical protein